MCITGGALKEGTIQERALFKGRHYSRKGTIQDRALFERGHYSREGTIQERAFSMLVNVGHTA